MRLKLFLLLSLFGLTMLAQQTGVRGVVVDATSGQPISGATVLLDAQGNTVTTGLSGDFLISDAQPGSDNVIVIGYGFKDWSQAVTLTQGMINDLGTIKVVSTSFNENLQNMQNLAAETAITESQLEDEEGNQQEIALLSGATDDPFYQAASYNFSIMRFRIRGYDSQKTDTYVNGIRFNDPVRGMFSYSSTGGLNQAFKNKTIGMGLVQSNYGFGGVGGTNNMNVFAKDYAPGFRGSVAYTNGNYRWRGMVTYSTGLMPSGWALTLSGVVRYADEGVYPGSFYNSAGYFVSLQKVLNDHHSLSLVTYGAPTKRASNSASTQEAYDLTGSNMYNPDWGWQEGEKRNARVVESYDPTAIFNWVWTPNKNTTLNTGFAFHKSFYSKAALGWHDAADPRPDYYRYFPSYYTDQEVIDLYTDRWTSEGEYTQIRWDNLYRTNLMNNYLADQAGTETGSTYIVEKRHSNQAVWALGSTLNLRINDRLTMQGGVSGNYTNSSYYKTVKDLLGGKYWLDVDQYSERDFPDNPAMAQNDMDNPNRRVGKGDRFGYDYDILTYQANVWDQYSFNLPKWDFFLSMRGDYLSFQRDGHMRNGRSPENSLGKGKRHTFFTAGIKGGATFKLDGRNSFTAHLYYGGEAPRPYDAYISPRTKDDVIDNLKSERIFSADLGYAASYRNFKGTVTAFYTDQRDNTERVSFYDDLNSTFMNYALTGVHKRYMGVELGLSYKLSATLTLEGAANISRYQYRNRPTGTRSYENGAEEDITQTVYLKNFYVSGTPQEAYSLALNWAGPHMWFVEVSGTWMNRSYVSLSPNRHELMPDLYLLANNEEELKSLISDITTQEKLNEAFVVNASIGHVIYLNRSSSLNINLNLTNLLNNKNIMTGGYQQGRFDYKEYNVGKFPNKYYYAQGFKMYLNVGVRF